MKKRDQKRREKERKEAALERERERERDGVRTQRGSPPVFGEFRLRPKLASFLQQVAPCVRKLLERAKPQPSRLPTCDRAATYRS